MAINALEKFLRVHKSKLETMVDESLSKETIIRLVRLVLQNQFFIYENKLYQQIYGGVSGSLLTIPLACMYLFYGHDSLSMINTIIQNENKLLFGRCRDNFFLTWNNSKDAFLALFNDIMINEQHSIMIPPPSPITATIGSSIHLLDLEISHYQGRLYTKIYHDSINDNYDLPNTFDFHKYQTSNLLKAALKHAVQCCSHEKDFDDQRRYLDLGHLRHGFPPDFIHKCIDEFYNELGIKTDTYFLYPIIPYKTLCQRVFENYEQQIALKNQEHTAKQQNIIRIPYPDDWDTHMAVRIKNDLLSIVKDDSNNKEIFDDIDIEMIPRPQTPLKMNDFLINRRPPLRLLTLPDNE